MEFAGNFDFFGVVVESNSLKLFKFIFSALWAALKHKKIIFSCKNVKKCHRKVNHGSFLAVVGNFVENCSGFWLLMTDSWSHGAEEGRKMSWDDGLFPILVIIDKFLFRMAKSRSRISEKDHKCPQTLAQAHFFP